MFSTVNCRGYTVRHESHSGTNCFTVVLATEICARTRIDGGSSPDTIIRSIPLGRLSSQKQAALYHAISILVMFHRRIISRRARYTLLYHYSCLGGKEFKLRIYNRKQTPRLFLRPRHHLPPFSPFDIPPRPSYPSTFLAKYSAKHPYSQPNGHLASNNCRPNMI